MCTLVAAFQHFARAPLVVAANRDEALGRPASPPRYFPRGPGGAVAHLAPVDELAQGTWLGVNEHRLFVAITNRFGAAPHPERSSRGLLVKHALAQPSARALRTFLAPLRADAVNAFHLFYADPREAFVTWSDGEVLHHRTLEPGVYVITERSFRGLPSMREAFVQTLWTALQKGLAAPDVDGLKTLLRQHLSEDLLGGPCVHQPAFGYGTRSSMIFALGPSWAASTLLYADGPPCETPFQSLAPLLGELGAGP